MPQGDYMELFRKRHGHRLDHFERKRKKEARSVHKRSQYAQKIFGLRAKLYNKKRYAEKAMMKKTYVETARNGAVNGPQGSLRHFDRWPPPMRAIYLFFFDDGDVMCRGDDQPAVVFSTGSLDPRVVEFCFFAF